MEHRRLLFGEPGYIGWKQAVCTCGWIADTDFFADRDEQWREHLSAGQQLRDAFKEAP